MSQEYYYETIFKRKSIRRYDPSALDQGRLAEISAFMHTLQPMHTGIQTELHIVSRAEVKSLMPAKAPHYILAYSETKDGYLANMGFLLQQMDLFFSANGIGSCWQGWVRPMKSVSGNPELEFIIALAFGAPAEPLHRKSPLEFKRKPLERIRTETNLDELFEPVRLAPTTRQPWFFKAEKGIIHAYCMKSNVFAFKRMDAIEMGIGLCHLWIAARFFDRNYELMNDAASQDDAPAGYDYFASVKII